MTKAEMTKEIERLKKALHDEYTISDIGRSALVKIYAQLEGPPDEIDNNIEAITVRIMKDIKKLNEKKEALDETNKVLSTELAAKYKELAMAKEGVSVLKEIIVAKEVKDYLKIRG